MPILIRGGGSSYRHAGAILGVLLFCAPASANPELENFRDFLDARENNGSIMNVSGCKPGSFDAACRGVKAGDPVATGINANLGWRVGMLAGQPLVEMAINWTPKNLEGMLPEIYAKADPGLVAGLDPAANAKLDLYDAHIAIAFEHEGQTYTITDTVGVPARAGNESSFNVAGSYDRGAFIRDGNGNLVDGETAKVIVKAGVVPIGASIVEAKINTRDLEHYWHEKNIEKYNVPLREAVESQISLLEDTFGLPVDEIRVELAKYEAEHSPQDVNSKLASMFARLTPANLPEKYLGTGLARDIKLRIYANAVGGIDGRLRNQMQELPPQPRGGASGYENWLDQTKVLFRTRELRLAQLRDDVREAQRIEYEIKEEERREAERRAEKRAEEEREAAWEAERRDEERARREAKARARYRDVHRPYGESDGGWNGITASINQMVQQTYGGYNAYADTGGNYIGNGPSNTIHLDEKRSQFKYPCEVNGKRICAP